MKVVGKMDGKKLDAASKDVIGDGLLSELGFVFLRGVFYRDLPTGVRHLLILDFNPAKQVLFAIVGLNADVLAGDAPADEAGAYHAVYLSPGGLRDAPVPYRAPDDKTARDSLERLRLALKDHGLPWLDAASTRAELAQLLPTTRDYEKASLLAADGRFSAALPWFQSYERRLVAMPGDAEVQAALAETRAQIEMCLANR